MQGSQLQLSAPPTEAEKENQTRTIQVIIAALIMGFVTAGGIFLFLAMGDKELLTDPSEFMFLFAIAFSSMCIVARGVVGVVMPKATLSQIKHLDREEQEARLWMSYQPLAIVRGALLEGPGFFTLTMFFVTGNLLLLYVAMGLLFLMIISFPSRFKIDNWVEDKLTQLDLNR
ncbi:hypothetical protein Pla110_05780 [Polystyrenella longa]|uniref:Uncharacterized protein n=2 Tax=Polystyrenella longa TaxID=2528007 RepID=A0A518CI74_9PLAN|nr:hypothetical protein Pla110_05780 [Polystyrenella longa]